MIGVKRSTVVPSSLAAASSWRGQDVLDQLHADFFGKCYLTESRVAPGGFEVEHRRPRGAGGDAYDWGNLYPCSHDANIRRKQSWPEGGLLHPDGRDDVEGRLVQRLIDDGNDYWCQFLAVDQEDVPARNTAAELSRLHNDDQTGPKARDLRDAIKNQVLRMYGLQIEVMVARRDRQATDLYRRDLEHRFQHLTSRRSPFTALLRSQVHPSLHDLFD